MSTDVDLSNIGVTLTLGGITDIDIGLDSIATALTTGVKLGLDNIKVDAGLGDIRIQQLAPIQIGLTQLPVVNVAVKELPLIQTDSKVDAKLDAKIDAGLDNIRITELPPIQLEFSFKPIRIHFPLNYSFSIELCGFRLFKFSLCGEGMVISEDYQPRKTESCG
jgi:predicted metalloprotease